MAEKTSWEVEMAEDVSPAARKAETALGRLHKQIQRFQSFATGRGMAGMNAVKDRVTGISSKLSVRGAREAVGGAVVRGSEKLTNFGKKWDKFRQNEGVSKAFEVASNAVMIAAAAAGALVAGITIATVKMADFGQKSRAAFSMMLGGQVEGEKAFMRSRELAKELGMDIADVTGSYQRFLSMGFDKAESEQLIKMGADMTALGNSSEKVRSVLDAMGKINATGTMQGDELMMLAEAGINIGSIYDVLGKKLGKTRAEIVKMKEAGKITSRQAIDAIKETVLATTKQTEFGAARKVVIASTLGGGWDKLKAEFRDKMVEIADASAPALAKALAKVNSRISKVMNGPDGEAMTGGIVGMIEWIASLIEDNIPAIEGFFRSFTEGAGEVLGPLREMASGMGFLSSGDKVSTAQMLGKAIGQLAGLAIGAAAALSGGFLQALISIANVMTDIVNSTKWLIDKLGSGWFTASDQLANVQAQRDYADRNGGSMAGISDSSLNDSVSQMGYVKAGSATGSKQINNNMTTQVTAQAPPGGTLEQGREWGQGVAQGNQRQQMRFFESVNAAQGT